MRVLILLLLTMTIGCSDPEVFTLQPVENQRAVVGQQIRLRLTVSGLGGAAPDFALSTPTIPTLNMRSAPPRFSLFGGGNVYLEWTPQADDVGVHEMTVTATGTTHTTRQSFEMIITAGDAAPVFLRPLGAGTTLDLSRANCFEFAIEVQDTDSVAGRIELDAPIEDGYTIIQSGDWTADFEWCPNEAQIEARSRYSLNISADDQTGHVTLKAFSLIIREAIGDNCPGRAPVIEHSPLANIDPSAPLIVNARVVDDRGLRTAPMVFYRNQAQSAESTTDLATFSSIEMELSEGDSLDGVYSVSIPLNFISDETQAIEYFIEATDDDDEVGNCDHRTRSPENGVNLVTLTPGSEVDRKGSCETCVNDDDCQSGFCRVGEDDIGECLERCGGNEIDFCISNPRGGCCGNVLHACIVEPAGVSRRTIECNGLCGWNDQAMEYSCSPSHPADPSGSYPKECATAACVSGYECSGRTYTSANGMNSSVCVPLGGRCDAGCEDDEFEPNELEYEATSLGAPPFDLFNLRLCGSTTDGSNDFYSFELAESGEVTVSASFVHANGDLDLSLRDDQYMSIDYAFGTTDNEEVSACVEAGVYTIKVFSFAQSIALDYALSGQFIPRDCCENDFAEPNNSPSTAPLVAELDLTRSLSICQQDRDYFLVDLEANERLIVDVIFDQLEVLDDLDVFVHDLNDMRLTPCCDDSNGQSITSDEHLEFTAPSAGRYAIVIEGYRTSSNEYYLIVEKE